MRIINFKVDLDQLSLNVDAYCHRLRDIEDLREMLKISGEAIEQIRALRQKDKDPQ